MRIVSGYRRDNPDSKVFIVVDGEALHAFRQAEAVAGAASCYLHLSSPLDDCDVPAEAMGHLFKSETELLAAVPELVSLWKPWLGPRVRPLQVGRYALLPE